MTCFLQIYKIVVYQPSLALVTLNDWVSLFRFTQYANPAYQLKNNGYYDLISPSAFFIFWSVLYCPVEYTAQIAAGIHPIKVICNIKQTIPEIGFLIVKNTTNGKNIANNNLIFTSLSDWFF